jgi:hypothetical protein
VETLASRRTSFEATTGEVRLALPVADFIEVYEMTLAKSKRRDKIS